MASSKPLIAFLALLVASCATGAGRGGAEADLLTLYREADGFGALGFRCYPALYRGGPGHPRYERMRRTLGERKQRVRERLVASYGEARIAEIENARSEEMHGIHWTGCDPEETAHDRLRYGRRLRQLERRMGLRG